MKFIFSNFGLLEWLKAFLSKATGIILIPVLMLLIYSFQTSHIKVFSLKNKKIKSFFASFSTFFGGVLEFLELYKKVGIFSSLEKGRSISLVKYFLKALMFE